VKSERPGEVGASGNLAAAIEYAVRGWCIFPCGPDKRPLTQNGLHDASSDPSFIIQWWRRWPSALIGIPTGHLNAFVVLDIDVKHGVNGFDTLARLGYASLPVTRQVRTQNGGLHLHFAMPALEIRNTNGAHGRGIGPGLDWRGEGGYVILPSPVGSYAWRHDGDLAEVPFDLLPREPRCQAAAPLRFQGVSTRYGEAALRLACEAIQQASAGTRKPR
jgi:hypothetical protein